MLKLLLGLFALIAWSDDILPVHANLHANEEELVPFELLVLASDFNVPQAGKVVSSSLNPPDFTRIGAATTAKVKTTTTKPTAAAVITRTVTKRPTITPTPTTIKRKQNTTTSSKTTSTIAMTVKPPTPQKIDRKLVEVKHVPFAIHPADMISKNNPPKLEDGKKQQRLLHGWRNEAKAFDSNFTLTLALLLLLLI